MQCECSLNSRVAVGNGVGILDGACVSCVMGVGEIVMMMMMMHLQASCHPWRH